MAAAPARNASMSKPCSAIGSSPTALITDVRPPIQSVIGKRASQPFAPACLSNSLPTPVTAAACLANRSPFAANFASASTIPFRVSFVPPDFETTMTSVCGSPSPILSSTRSKPSGSVLSKKKMSIGSSGEPRAADTNCGPNAEPPIPMYSRCLKRLLSSAEIFPL